MIEIMSTNSQNAVIKVIGVGGCGGNAVNTMLEAGIEEVEFIVANTDAQALASSKAKTVLQIGTDLTRGLGAGAVPEIGRKAAEEDRDRIQEVIEGADMLFITAGMGGGTGTGAAPVVAEIAREMGILTVAVVTRPFDFEAKRKQLADQGIEELVKYVDSLITIPNEKLLSILGRNVKFRDALVQANDVLKGAVQGISDVIVREGLINVDFADVKTVMTEKGMAMMGSGSATGENRAREAAEKAISSPFLEDVNVRGATGVLVNITAGYDFTLAEYTEVGNVIEEFSAEGAMNVVGAVFDPALEETNELRVTVIATGLGGKHQAEEEPSQKGGTTNSPAPNREGDYPAEKLLDRRSRPRLVEVRPERRFSAVEKSSASGGYEQFDVPTVTRLEAEKKAQAPTGFSRDIKDIEYLDIPSFLRRQAD